MNKQWILKLAPPIHLAEKLSKEINVSKPISNILLLRNIDNWEKAKSFFRPHLEQLHNPLLMKDMDKAVERLNEAIEKKQKILFYGDYDVDGTTSVAMYFIFFRDFYQNIIYYIPDRSTEGYGVSKQGIDYAVENEVKLIITLDCGIRAIDKIHYGRTKEIDFIVCDHHQPDKEIPSACAVLDPKRNDCGYPFKELSGCGVGFKLLEAFSQKKQIAKEKLFDLLDLLAISIACDIVPVRGENRILLKHGLELINKNPRKGIEYLIRIAGLKDDLNVSDLVFGLGPRINAPGRIEHAKYAVELLMAQDDKTAQDYALKLDEFNKIRKDYDANTSQEALDLIQKNQLRNKKTTVLFQPDWYKGIVGIVASRCIEKYYKPTIILTESEGKAVGSARSVDGFNILKAIQQCEHLIEEYGGHQAAAGLTINIENISLFQDFFEKIVSQQITKEQCIPKIYIDTTIKLDDINLKFYNVFSQMAPFGPTNMQPVFLSENVITVGSTKILKNKHLKFSIKQQNGKKIFEAIGFNLAHHYELLIKNRLLDICYTIEENNFMDRYSLGLIIKDIRVGN